ncbi:MAG: flagellar hook protein FlgE [Myxococcota bacterium]
MALTSSLYAGLSSLSANGRSLQVTSDNIANVNTVGFRGSRTQFEDLLAQSVVGVGELGSGVRLSGIERLFEQGAIIGTQRATDLAINGRGFFVLRSESDPQELMFTRNGQFSADNDGFLETATGLRVQGYPADGNGGFLSTLGDIRIAEANVPPQATSSIDLSINLPSSAPVSANPFNINDVDGTTQASTSIVIYDALGAPHQGILYFTKSAPNQWDYNLVISNADLGLTPTEDATAVATGQLGFTSDGLLDTEVGGSFTVDFPGATTNSITLDFGQSITTDGASTPTGSSQFDRPTSVNQLSQDGFAAGEFQALSVGEDGVVEASFTNGQTRAVARVAMANFVSQEGLRRVGGNMFQETEESGNALIGFANSGGRGAILGASLEQANVDLSTEFVRLINDQRAFQAATRTITTADELLAEVVNLIR